MRAPQTVKPLYFRAAAFFLCLVLLCVSYVLSAFYPVEDVMFYRAGLSVLLLFLLTVCGERLFARFPARRLMLCATIILFCGLLLFAFRHLLTAPSTVTVAARAVFIILAAVLLSINMEKIGRTCYFYWAHKEYRKEFLTHELYLTGEDLVKVCYYYAGHLFLLLITLSFFGNCNWLITAAWAYISNLSVGILLWFGAHGRWEGMILGEINTLEQKIKALSNAPVVSALEQLCNWQEAGFHLQLLRQRQRYLNMPLFLVHRMELIFMGVIYMFLAVILSF